MAEFLKVLNCSAQSEFPVGSSNPNCASFEFDDSDILGKIRDKTPKDSNVADVWQVNQGTALVCDRTSCKSRCNYSFS